MPWRKSGGADWTDRGDPSAWDFQHTDLTWDGSWHTLDLSSIIPEGASWAYIGCYLEDDAAGTNISFRPAGNSNTVNKEILFTHVANVGNWMSFWIPLNAGREIEYGGSILTVTSCLILVKAYY